MQDSPNTASQAIDEDAALDERRSGVKDRRQAKVDRRNLERLAEDIAPRRHPDIRGRRAYDE